MLFIGQRSQTRLSPQFKIETLLIISLLFLLSFLLPPLFLISLIVYSSYLILICFPLIPSHFIPSRHGLSSLPVRGPPF